MRLFLTALCLVLAGCNCAGPGLVSVGTGNDAGETDSGILSDGGRGGGENGGGAGGNGGGANGDGGGGGTTPTTCAEGTTRSCFNGDASQGGIGDCALGTQTCLVVEGALAWSDCTGSGMSSTEMCDGKDNDCDGTVDNGCPCSTGQTQPCNSACGLGDQVCAGGQWQACTAPMPMDEKCDGVDNDCDGMTDEGTAGCELFYEGGTCLEEECCITSGTKTKQSVSLVGTPFTHCIHHASEETGLSIGLEIPRTEASDIPASIVLLAASCCSKTLYVDEHRAADTVCPLGAWRIICK